jgi:hypothetical protein
MAHDAIATTMVLHPSAWLYDIPAPIIIITIIIIIISESELTGAHSSVES